MLGPLRRGLRNGFRNPPRTIAVTAILGISLGLVLVMLAAQTAVDNRIAEVKTTIGNTITVSPAGARGFLGGGEPLTDAQVGSLATVPNVSSVSATIDAQMMAGTDTSLASAIEAGTLGNRQRRIFVRDDAPSGTSSVGDGAPAFTPPIFAVGTNDANYGGAQVGGSITMSSGAVFDPSTDADVAVIGSNLATKNGLSVGSTFTAFDTTITVDGIFDAGNEFANNAVVFPLATLQRLSDQPGEVTEAIVHVDSADHLASTVTAIQSSLGDSVDVTSSADTIDASVKPLENIRTIATTSLYGALLAATVITLLTMVMVVRERRKEIAVLKAIGGGDATIVTQFVTESVVFSLLGSVVGMVLGFILANPILHALLSSSTADAGPTVSGGVPDRGAIRVAIGGFRAVQGAVRDLQAAVDLRLVLISILAAVVVAILGSALPAWLISKVRPAEVLRND